MQNLLMLAKMDESSTKLPMCEFDISTAAEDTVGAFIEPAALKGIMIEQNIKKGIRLNGNRDSIVQLMTVLLDNAVKYTESGGVIRAELYGNEKNITLSIANTCEPIDHPEKLFDRFYRNGENKAGGRLNDHSLGIRFDESDTITQISITYADLSVNY